MCKCMILLIICLRHQRKDDLSQETGVCCIKMKTAIRLALPLKTETVYPLHLLACSKDLDFVNENGKTNVLWLHAFGGFHLA